MEEVMTDVGLAREQNRVNATVTRDDPDDLARLLKQQVDDLCYLQAWNQSTEREGIYSRAYRIVAAAADLAEVLFERAYPR
ncbi:MAG: hypothetical protein KJ058_07820 [Thermoanaerobaculia bacterium]|nr:hypothetical protein [Thermoanaerobaculia bacterium]